MIKLSKQISLIIFILFFSINKIYCNEKLIYKYFYNIYNYNFKEALISINEYKLDFSEKENTINSLHLNYYLNLYEKDNNKKYIASCKKYSYKIIDALENKNYISDDNVFELINAQSVLLRFAIKGKKYFTVMSQLSKIYEKLVYILKNHKYNEKFKLVAGIYYYYAYLASVDYPILYKFMYFMPKGNRFYALKLLKECNKSKNIYIQRESLYYLARIWHRDEKNYEQSENYYLILLQLHPANLFWRKEYIKLIEKFDVNSDKLLNQKKLLSFYSSK